MQFRCDLREQSEVVERAKAGCRVVGGEDPLDLRADPIAGERGGERSVAADHRRGRGLDGEAEARREAHGAEHAQRILAKPFRRISHGAQQLGVQV